MKTMNWCWRNWILQNGKYAAWIDRSENLFLVMQVSCRMVVTNQAVSIYLLRFVCWKFTRPFFSCAKQSLNSFTADLHWAFAGQYHAEIMTWLASCCLGVGLAFSVIRVVTGALVLELVFIMLSFVCRALVTIQKNIARCHWGLHGHAANHGNLAR